MIFKSIIKSKKGMAIELVIFTTVVVFALCSVMMIYGMRSTSIGIFGSARIDEKTSLDQIGEDYLKYLYSSSKTGFDTSVYTYEENKQDRNYYFSFNTSTNENSDGSKKEVYEMIVSRANKVVFQLAYEYDNEKSRYIIIKWIYE